MKRTGEESRNERTRTDRGRWVERRRNKEQKNKVMIVECK